MDIVRFLSPLAAPLETISLADLQRLKRELDDQEKRFVVQLDAAEHHKDALFDAGLREVGQRKRRALARQVRDRDEEAAGYAALLRLIHKQHLLLDRLIWAKETLDTAADLARTAPLTMLDWPALVEASAEAENDEQRLNQLLQALGVPQEEWPRAEARDDLGRRLEELAGDAGLAPWPLVRRVLDGRTIELVGGEQVHYIGLDVPLMEGLTGVPEAGAAEVREANRRLVEGQRVRLEADEQDRDADGALLRYVYVGKRMINAELIRSGHAYHQSHYPNTRHDELFARLQAEARRRKRGLWRK